MQLSRHVRPQVARRGSGFFRHWLTRMCLACMKVSCMHETCQSCDRSCSCVRCNFQLSNDSARDGCALPMYGLFDRLDLPILAFVTGYAGKSPLFDHAVNAISRFDMFKG